MRININYAKQLYDEELPDYSLAVHENIKGFDQLFYRIWEAYQLDEGLTRQEFRDLENLHIETIKYANKQLVGLSLKKSLTDEDIRIYSETYFEYIDCLSVPRFKLT